LKQYSGNEKKVHQSVEAVYVGLNILFKGRTNNVTFNNLSRNSDTGTCGNNPYLAP